MIIEKSFFGLPLISKMIQSPLSEEIIRSLFYSEIIEEIKRFTFRPEGKVIVQMPYPIHQQFNPTGRRYADLYVDLSNIPQSSNIQSIDIFNNYNWIEIKYFSQPSKKTTSITKCGNIGKLINAMLRLVFLPGSKDCGRYLLTVFHGDYTQHLALQSNKKKIKRDWIKPIFEPNNPDYQPTIKINWQDEVKSVVEEIDKGFSHITSIDLSITRFKLLGNSKNSLNWYLLRIDGYK
jgi:hypothetical protein